jgi:ribosome-binding factor A
MLTRRILALSSRYRLYQQLDKQLLNQELEAIDEVVRDSVSSARNPYLPLERKEELDVMKNESIVREKTLNKARRMMGIGRKSNVDPSKVQRYTSVGEKFTWEDETEYKSQDPDLNVRHALEKYESLKGTKKAGYSDLTHSELRRVEELRERKKMLERKIKWLKNNQIIDPVRFVGKEFKKKARDEYKAKSDSIALGDEVISLPHFGRDFDPVMASKIKKVEFTMARDTAIARMRSEIRKEKLERSAIMKTTTPSIGETVTDPLKRHLKRRNVRVSLLLQQYLEEILSCNTAQIVIDHLKGAAISIDRIESPTTRGRHDVYVRVSSDHDKEWLQSRLDVLAPKLRSQLAVRVNYGYTPELKFHIVDDVDKFNKNRLMKLADEVRIQVDKQLNDHFIKEMNWK